MTKDDPYSKLEWVQLEDGRWQASAVVTVYRYRFFDLFKMGGKHTPAKAEKRVVDVYGAITGKEYFELKLKGKLELTLTDMYANTLL